LLKPNNLTRHQSFKRIEPDVKERQVLLDSKGSEENKHPNESLTYRKPPTQ